MDRPFEASIGLREGREVVVVVVFSSLLSSRSLAIKVLASFFSSISLLFANHVPPSPLLLVFYHQLSFLRPSFPTLFVSSYSSSCPF